MNREDIIRMAREAGFKASVGKTDKDDKYHPDVNAIGRDVPVEWLERFAALVAAAERNKLAAWMIQFGFATGHGDTMEQLVDALGSEIVDRIEIEIDVAVAAEREACAKVCIQMGKKFPVGFREFDCAAAIRARGNT